MISVIIPVYKNLDLFLKNLRHNIPYLKDCQIIVINDDPTKSIKANLEQIKSGNIALIENKNNLGFGESVNQGAASATGKYLMLLNSDVLLNDQSYLLALKDFDKETSLFAVSFAQKEKDGRLVGRNILYWQGGLFKHRGNSIIKAGPTGWAEGGASIINREKFNYLGGFDPIYSPFYWEDIDLSYRAWKLGCRVLFNPAITVIHHHESTIGKYFNPAKITSVAYRNQLIFTAKNISDLDLRVKFILNLPLFFIKSLLKNDQVFLHGILEFLSIQPKLINSGTRANRKNIQTDKQVLSNFSHE